MTPFEDLPAARQKEIVAAADRDLADNVTLNRIYLAGRDIYDAVFTERNWYNIVQDMEDGEPVFNVGLDAYVAGSDIDAAFHGKPAEWPYIWQARSCYGPGCSSHRCRLTMKMRLKSCRTSLGTLLMSMPWNRISNGSQDRIG